MDTAGEPVPGVFDVRPIGDVGAYEPDGGTGISTNRDGSFYIERIAEMGWTISIVKFQSGTVIGCTHLDVKGGKTTNVRMTVFP